MPNSKPSLVLTIYKSRLLFYFLLLWYLWIRFGIADSPTTLVFSAYLFVAPHLRYFWHSHRLRSDAFVRCDIAVDWLSCSLLLFYHHFDVALTTMIITVMMASSVTLVGWLFSTAALGAQVLLAVMMTLLLGWPIEQWRLPDVSLLLVVGLYVTLVANNAYQQMRKLAQAKQQIEKQAHLWQRAVERLGCYLPMQLVLRLLNNEIPAEPELQRKRVTVCFCDLTGFTQLIERWQPEDVALLLNEYLTEMAEVARRHQATVDKFIGDAVMVFFGAPESQGSQVDAQRCVAMAVEMRQVMGQMKKRWRRQGYRLDLRIGIASGICSVGHFGYSQRLDYTVVGSAVNVAARLQTSAEPGEILINEETQELADGQFNLSAAQYYHLKGYQQPVVAYAINPSRPSLGTQRLSGDGFLLEINYQQIDKKQLQRLVDELQIATAAAMPARLG